MSGALTNNHQRVSGSYWLISKNLSSSIGIGEESISLMNTSNKVVEEYYQHSIVHKDIFVKEFEFLADLWEEDTIFVSSISEKISHYAYKRIIEMGRTVIPLILKRMVVSPDFWFEALTKLTGENPVTESEHGDIFRMTEKWIQWGQEHGFYDF